MTDSSDIAAAATAAAKLRARTILSSPAGRFCPRLASLIALDTDLSVEQAAAFLEAAALDKDSAFHVVQEDTADDE